MLRPHRRIKIEFSPTGSTIDVPGWKSLSFSKAAISFLRSRCILPGLPAGWLAERRMHSFPTDDDTLTEEINQADMAIFRSQFMAQLYREKSD